MDRVRKIVSRCKTFGLSSTETLRMTGSDDEEWDAIPDEITESTPFQESPSSFFILAEVKIYCSKGCSFKTVRHILTSFCQTYAGNRRMIGLVKVILGLTLSQKASIEGRFRIYRVKRGMSFKWRRGRGPLEGEELDYSQELKWEEDEEFMNLLIKISAQRYPLAGRPWSVWVDNRACQVFEDLNLMTEKSEEGEGESTLME
ncbi:TPA: Matrix protein [Anole lyssa-like virus 1]|uniref:Matrix protein n=1 Tax=Anole lyssa-like virus 1 TaxID=2772344 RepID=A0AAD3AW85_9RHAB|nr:Matrix protein [Anole lyssa-like virus 1]FAA01390.1 TPA: Matrix protein [Anole lyssa-like virus 1]